MLRTLHVPSRHDDFWARLVDGELEATKIKLPAPEDLLLALCIHGSKHLWERLAWIADIAGLIESQPSLNWNELVNRARGDWQ